jgi:hypothetical protein
MKKIAHILFFISTAAFAQNNQNNAYVPVNNTNNSNNSYYPNDPVNMPNDEVNTQDNQEENAEINNNKVNYSNNNANGPTGNGVNNGTNGMVNTNEVKDPPQQKEEKPYCKECEELKKLKRQQTQQYFSGHETGTANKHRWAKFCGRTNKKMKQWFAKDKKKRSNYSCFNW